MKKLFAFLIAVFFIALTGCSPTGVPQADYDKVVQERDVLREHAIDLQVQLTTLQTQMEKLNEDLEWNKSALEARTEIMEEFRRGEFMSKNDTSTLVLEAADLVLSRIEQSEEIQTAASIFLMASSVKLLESSSEYFSYSEISSQVDSGILLFMTETDQLLLTSESAGIARESAVGLINELLSEKRG